MAIDKKSKQILFVGIAILLAILFFNGSLFSIFGTNIPLEVTTVTCTGTLSYGDITQEDCTSFKSTAYGSSSGWSFSTNGEGTITLSESSKSFILTGKPRAEKVQIYNYATSTYEDIAFDYSKLDTTQNIAYTQDYLDPASSTIAKFKWNLVCGNQCAAGVEQLRITSFDSIVDTTVTTTVSTSTTPTTTILVTGSQTTTIQATTTIGTETTITSAGQQGTITSSSTLILILVFAIAGIVAYLIFRRQ